jgi:hypothetical protein
MEFLVLFNINMKPRPIRNVKSVKFNLANFGHLALVDLQHLKDDRQWLSDVHITFALLYVPILFYTF